MKRLLVAGSILAVIALVLGGNRLLELTLDAELGDLLTRELGIPVTLAPIKANVLKLTASSPKLVMGDPDKPALVATDVEVTLAWSDLLDREIRLVRATGTDLVVQPSRWPTKGGPWPDDYSFLDPWLPSDLQLESAKYVAAEGDELSFEQLQWQRQPGGGATLDGTQQQDKLAIAFSTELKSLADLLQLDRMDLEMSAAVDGDDASKLVIAIDMQPGDKSGYSLHTQLRGAGIAGKIVSGNSQSWKFPAQSVTTIEHLETKSLRRLLSSYFPATEAADADPAETELSPRLPLQKHRGTVTIDQIQFKKDVLTGTYFDFTTDAQGIAITSLRSNGPAGVVQGELSLTRADGNWALSLTSDILATKTGQGLASPFLDSVWLWRTGRARLHGLGNTWKGMLYSLEGELDLAGSHRGKTETPVTIKARLDNEPDLLVLKDVEIELARGRITGEVRYAGHGKRQLAGNIHAEQVHLDYLFADTATPAPPGVAVPEFLDALPGVELDWDIEISDLHISSSIIKHAKLKLTRTPALGQLMAVATGHHKGTLELRLTAIRHQDKPSEASLQAKIQQFNLPRLFGQGSGLFDSRSSGTISFEGKGNGVEQVFKALRGSADLTTDFRADHNWRRAANPKEQLRITGNAGFVIEQQRLLGLDIDKLTVDSVLQNLTGKLSMVDGRAPWLVADLKSDKLDIPNLVDLKSGDQAGQEDPLDMMRKADALSVSLEARQVNFEKMPLTGVKLKVSSAPERIAIEQLDFSSSGGQLRSKGGISWKRNQAKFSANVQVTDFNLDSFLIQDNPEKIPVSGSLVLSSTGQKLPELLAGLHGNIKLDSSAAAAGTDPKSRRKLAVIVRRTADGMEADVDTFQWGESELVGSLSYHATQPPRFEVEISEGSLSLLPWEQAAARNKKKASKPHTEEAITRAAKASADFVGGLLLTPLRLVTGDSGQTKPGDKLFSDRPLSFDWLDGYQASVKGKLDKVTSQVGSASQLEFTASLVGQKLEVKASTGQFNGGSADVRVDLDASSQPTRISFDGNFKNIRGTTVKDDYPRSGYLSLTSQGQSEAALAANLNGLGYLELGRGSLDYRGLILLTANVATSVLETLIPGADKKPPELQCGATFMTFKDGIGTTPYGYAARTRRANLVGSIEVNLQTEQLKLGFSSSSRKGLGFSVGSVFSNTVQVRGPLTDPSIVPNPTGILWRGWAAVMTGGLSVVGESVLKRALASDDPCIAIKKHIREDLCKPDQLSVSSPLICLAPG